MNLLKITTFDNLVVKVYSSRQALGEYAALDAADRIIRLLKEKDEINIIFAAAPSQDEFLKALISNKHIDWSKINAFHMDEYIGLAPHAPQGFGNFLKERIFSKVGFKSVNYINGNNTDLDYECTRYAELLKEHPLDIGFMGIGENGHLAFNDPGVADFKDSAVVKVVELEEACRRQQVNDGCFKSLEDVPKKALTVTIPPLFSAKYIFCMVPAATKAEAVKNTLTGPIDESCPASILRRHNNAILYLDTNSGKHIL